MPDFFIGEMNAGGWRVPLNPNPRIYGYINQGNLKFEKVVLSEGFGVHEAKIASKKYEGKPLIYGCSTIQSWHPAMVTHLSTWTIKPVK